MTAARLTSFLVKVASRCNLDCDYCYVYHHADQSWRSLPRLLSASDRTAFGDRLSRYVRQEGLKRCVIVFHGGEPLLAGADTLAQFAVELRAAVGEKVSLDIGMQTNGLLLTDAALDTLAAADIAVSLSLDGPQEANDRHRTTRRRRSSFVRVTAALERLKQRPKTFAGVIAVIDPATRPAELFEFFEAHQLPKLDFLLPDAHHERPPPGRAEIPYLYRDWLIEAFDLWLDSYSGIPIRTFEAVLDTVAGLPSGTDAFGLGDVSLITIETDGTYHDLDVFKVVGQGATKLVGSVSDTDIADVAASSVLAAHRALLRKSGLCATCQACPVVDACGAGSLPHRFDANGFNNPSIYCEELKALFTHAKRRLMQILEEQTTLDTAQPPPFDLAEFELAERSGAAVAHLWEDARRAHVTELTEAVEALVRSDPSQEMLAERLRTMPMQERVALASRPGIIAWQNVIRNRAAGRSVHAVDGAALAADGAYLRAALGGTGAEVDGSLVVHGEDEWLRRPFSDAIIFEPAETNDRAAPLVEEALRIIADWRPALSAELRKICSAVQFVRDPTAHPDKIVSFSDNTVPGALYVSVRQGHGLIDAHELADSLIHEYRHQKLYLFERHHPTVTSVDARVASPWREDLRPPSGLVHAVFVFIELQRYWEHVLARGPACLHNRALNQIAETRRNLTLAFSTLESCPLSVTGRQLVKVMRRASDRELVEGQL